MNTYYFELDYSGCVKINVLQQEPFLLTPQKHDYSFKVK